MTPLTKLDSDKTLKQSLIEPFTLFPAKVYAISFFGTIYEIMACVVCIGQLPIVNVSIFVNMAPLFTVLLAVWVLNERLTCFNAT